MLLRHCLPAARLSRRWTSQLVGVLLPGLDFPAPYQARRGIRADRAIVLILQWARIVTESQSAAATGIITRGGTPISRKYNARTAKKRWACTIPATGVFTRFSHVPCFQTGFGRTRGPDEAPAFPVPARSRPVSVLFPRLTSAFSGGFWRLPRAGSGQASWPKAVRSRRALPPPAAPKLPVQARQALRPSSIRS